MEKLDIGAIKNKVNIYDIVCQVIQLKRVGNKYMGLCPFHDEKTPSFYVTPSRQIFKCFGCGKGGDVIAFIQELNGLTLPSVAMIFQLRAIDRRRIVKKIGRLEPEILTQIDEKIWQLLKPVDG